MTYKIRKVSYFYTRIRDEPGEAYSLLKILSELGINLLAFNAIPTGPGSTQLAIFPEEPVDLIDVARKANLKLDGPHHALLVQGDDELGALVDVHNRLYEAKVNVYASSGVSDGAGSYGYIIYVRPDSIDRAIAALGIKS
jgi:hypothetical protein